MAQRITQKLNNAEKILVIEALTSDKYNNFSALEYYLKQILAGRDVIFRTSSDTDFVVPAGEAWRVISQWGATPDANLPLGDRGSMRLRASSLLSYIQTNLIGKTTEAAASYRLILDQAERPLVKPGQSTTDPVGVVLQKAYDLRRTQIAQLQNGLIGKLATNLERTAFLKNIPDAPTRVLVMQMIAASSLNFRSDSDFTPEKINQLLLHQPGYKQLNNAIHLAYSRATQGDLAEMGKTVNDTIYSHYRGNEAKYLADMDSLRELSDLAPNLSDVGWMVDHLAFAASPAEKSQLVSAIRSQIVASARGNYQEGGDILSAALKRAGLPDTSLSSLESLVPYLEEIEVKQRHLLLGASLSDRDPRLLATASLAAGLGVDLTTPWLEADDLKAITDQITAKFGVSTLLEAAAATTDPKELSEIKNLLSKTSDFNYYHTALGSSLLLSGQESLAKGQGNLAAAAHPLSELSRKIWAGYVKVDDVINAPVRGLSNWWENTTEKFPVLDPAKFALTKWAGFQTGIALRIHTWAIGVSTSSWFSGFAGHIADFTEGFIKHEADWAGAGSFFFERKWGNVLDWAAKRAGKESWLVAKTALWDGAIHAIEINGNKLAAGLGSKIATTLAGLATSEAGLGLFILGAQVGWEVLKFGFGKIRDFITNAGGFRDWVINRIPLMVGGFVTGLLALPALFLSGLGALGTGLLAFLATTLGSLAGLFALAATWAFALVVGGVLIFYIFKPTTQIDSGLAQLATNLLCDNSDPEANKVLSCANCLVKYLTECYGPRVTKQTLGKGLGCLLAKSVAPEAASLIERSANSFTYLQCVGFVQAAMACGGSSLQGQNACSYITSKVSGFTFVAGLSGAKPGDAIVFRSSSTCSDSAPGHIGILKQDAGALVCLVDANQKCSGCVSNNNCLPKTNVAGYLKKI